MQQLGKSLKDINIDKIYVGMKVGFINPNDKSGSIAYGKVFGVKKQTPKMISISAEGNITYGENYNGIVIDIDNGPLISSDQNKCDLIYFAE